MIFVVHALDRAGTEAARQKALPAHRAYLSEAPATLGIKVLMSGPLVSDDGDAMIGSLLLLKADTRAQIEALLGNDPMAHADVWDGHSLTRVSIRQNTVGTLEDGA